ncbi:MAG: replication-relaxation family protein, partial [Mycobacteriales bacterium]
DQLLRARLGEGTRHRFHEPSLAFLDHTLAVADAHLALLGAERTGQLELTSQQLEPDCWRHYLNGGGGNEVLRPDLFVITAAGAFEDCWFIEVDRGTESLPALLRKCAAYEAYRRSGREQARQGTFPLVVWQLPSEARVAKLQAALRQARGVDASIFRLVTPDHLVALLAGDSS